MSEGKVKAAKIRVYSPPEGVAADTLVHVYTFDVFNKEFLPGKSFDNIERAAAYQRHEQERIYTEQEADPALFDLPFLSSDSGLLERIGKDPDYRQKLVRDLTSDARNRAPALIPVLIGLALSALFALAGPDTTLRVPGTRTLRFGLETATVQARGFAIEPDEEGRFALQGASRFFGLDAHAVLGFAEGHLSTAVFRVDSLTPRQWSWFTDELRRMGFARRCTRDDDAGHDCIWQGRGVEMVTSYSAGGGLSANTHRLEFAAIPDTAVAADRDVVTPSDGAATSGAATGAPPLLADTLVVEGEGRSDRRERRGLRAAVVQFRPQLAYPTEARASGVQGRVWVLARVDTAGVVREAHSARGIAPLNASAIAHVLGIRFRPLRDAGRAVEFLVEVPVVFVR